MNKLKEYLEQDVWNPKYLFHGSPYIFDVLEPRQSFDSQNKDNEGHAIFLTSWFINAAAYAFRNRLKDINEYYDFSLNNNGELPAMNFQVENLPDDLYGFIYVFAKTDDMIKDDHQYTTQYRCYHELCPIDVVKVYYKDFAGYFNGEISQKSK